ncbi:unnamed protein product [Didymodactylos carnosus]|uniref:Protein kinase domain-containing protein n=1 Tax=Didymodactylos carnosus TaxID=1234261 RepID=A0A814KCR3_9BILA|nr:unnamed protein product [Didymodactylos carnosus]CAF1403909.1 unnamed protein product [Didymodactylos carnosus]CAF3819282.1 unnamed protein product [Didymodactylos carnosus]CAF4210196.1 unnamed protein product [Didymodactylos carnosus]
MDEYYQVQLATVTFVIPRRYENLRFVAAGGYGAVACALDRVTNREVAIKKLLKPFETDIHAKRAYRELKLLMHLNNKDASVVQIFNVFTPDQRREFNTLYFVLNYARGDLAKVLHNYQKHRQRFQERDIQVLIYSLLRGLKYIHSAGIIHRDLKPSNIGVDRDFNLSILDFGLARVVMPADRILTGYVQTRWWRAPETIYNWENYSSKADLFSVGCIMAELVLLRPLFTGGNFIEQLRKILEVLGTPSNEELAELCEPYAYAYIRDQIGDLPRLNFQNLFRPLGLSHGGINLLELLLQLNPARRPSVEEALAHPYLASMYDPTDEPTAPQLNDPHQDETHTINEWKAIIWDLIGTFQVPEWFTQNTTNSLN